MNIVCIAGKRGAGDALSEFTEQGIPFNFKTIDENKSEKAAHNEAVEIGKIQGNAIVCEHDIMFTSKKSLETFVNSMQIAYNEGFDILLGGADTVYGNSIHQVDDFHGNFIYAILNDEVDISKCPKTTKLSTWLAENYKVQCCHPMIAVRRSKEDGKAFKTVELKNEELKYPVLL